MAAYQAATHTPLAFLHADIQCSQDWQSKRGPAKAAAHRAGMPFGIIYDGVGKSDVAGTNGAVGRFKQIEANDAWRPDHAIFQSWEPYPTRMLPETEPGTLTT